MKARDSTNHDDADVVLVAVPRYLRIKQLSAYTGRGETKAIEIGDISGARRKYGKRILYDREAIDRYISTLPED